jgi:CDP-diglyceride synthetase
MGEGTQTKSSTTSQAYNLLIIFSAVIVILIHVGLLFYNKTVFNIIACFYVIAFVILMMVLINKKKEHMSNKEYSFIFYVSVFIITIEIMLLVLSTYKLAKLVTKKEGAGNPYWPYNSRYR